MDFDKLVETITEIVLNNINIQKDKRRILALYDFEDSKVKKYMEEKYVVDYLDSDSDLKEFEIIIAPKLCINGLANIASGKYTDKLQEIYLKSILQGKKVIQIEEGMEYKEYVKTIPKSLLDIYEEYKSKLEECGVKVLNKEQLMSCDIENLDDFKKEYEDMKEKFKNENLSSNMICEEEKEKKVIKIRNKKLINEVYLRKLYMNGVTSLEVDKKSIITPLAMDYVRINHLRIKRI